MQIAIVYIVTLYKKTDKKFTMVCAKIGEWEQCLLWQDEGKDRLPREHPFSPQPASIIQDHRGRYLGIFASTSSKQSRHSLTFWQNLQQRLQINLSLLIKDFRFYR